MKYPIEQIRNFCEQVWEKAGLSHEDAVSCTDALLSAELPFPPASIRRLSSILQPASLQKAA